MRNRKSWTFVLIALSLTGCSSPTPESSSDIAKDDLSSKRSFTPTLDGKWIGNGISYGAYRDGEAPGEGLTSKENILEDLTILAKRWNLIRLYGADQQALCLAGVLHVPGGATEFPVDAADIGIPG